MKRAWLAVVLAMAAGAAAGQSRHGGEDARAVKSLSPQQVDDLREGRGMGLAMAAELNHHPGPRHVLDLADELHLTEQQRIRTRAIFDAMNAKAKDLGVRLVALERDLDRRFAEGAIDRESLRSLTSEIGGIQGELRRVHLAAHLEQRAVLTDRQVRLYDRLRGYGGAHAHRPAHAH